MRYAFQFALRVPAHAFLLAATTWGCAGSGTEGGSPAESSSSAGDIRHASATSSVNSSSDSTSTAASREDSSVPREEAGSVPPSDEADGSRLEAGVLDDSGAPDATSYDAGGEAGPSAYRPCPTNGSPCTILPLGDSITLGFRSSDDAGYRSQLFKLVVAAKQKVTFTGSLTNGPTEVSGQPFPRMHEGHSGWTISQLSPLFPSPALDGKPTIILLHIGTNDIGSRDPAGMATHLDALLDKIVQDRPDALIVVAQITAAFTDNDIRDAYNAMIPSIVQLRAARGQHIIGVDMNKIPMIDLSSDGVHPNDQGYAYMANIWYAAIKDLLPQ